MTLTRQSVLRRPSDVRFRRVGNEWVVIRQRSAEVIVLNECAGRVLDLIDGSRSLDEIAGILSAEYEGESSAIRSDVLRFAAELEQSGLGEAVSPPAEARP